MIWDFDSPFTSPTKIRTFGYFYAYTTTTVKGKGINGTNALEINVPVHKRREGGGCELSSNTPLDLTSPVTTAIIYGFVAADKPSTFGVSLEVYSNGNKFIPSPGPYVVNGQKLQGQIDTQFKPVQFDLNTFERYHSTAPPDLKSISSITWFFVANTQDTTGPLHFYLDNVGASDKPIPNELANPDKKQ